MAEQLWYTWSRWGFGMTVGTRVRAASQGFMDARGAVNMQGDRFLTLMNYLNYSLPQDTIDPYEVNPQQAPRSLVFAKAGAEWIVVNRIYTGLDGVKRAGAFFSHLLADLPTVSSFPPGRQINFSAREAINLWGSAFWRESEEGREPREAKDPADLNLEQVSLNKLISFPGHLSRTDIVQEAGRFQYVLSALLTLPTLGNQKRLYIAAPPQTVAALIWGVMHALPRTLELMRTLSFSTYEHNVEEKGLPTVVGTCWLSPVDPGNTPRDLPLAYYEPNNPYGLAINCYLSGRQTPFTANPAGISRFVEFATNCYMQNTTDQLDEVLDKAEEENITEVSKFLQHYASLQDNLSKEEVMDILVSLSSKARIVIEKVLQILRERKIPLLATEMPRWDDFKFEMEKLKRENVRRSILRLMAQDTVWWQEQGQAVVRDLCQLANTPTQQTLVTLGNAFLNKGWKKGQLQEISGNLRHLMQDYTGSDPVTAFANHVIDIVIKAQDKLAEALLPLASDLAKKVQQAIGKDDLPRTSFWTNILDVTIPIPVEGEVWAYLLELLSVDGMNFNPTYNQWWVQYGKPQARELRQLADQSRGSKLASAFTAFAKKAAVNFALALLRNDGDTAIFWASVLKAAASPASEPGAWKELLQVLLQAEYTSAYQHWWEREGEAALKEIRSLVLSSGENELMQPFLFFRQKAVLEVQSAIEQEKLTLLSFCERVLATLTPYASNQTKLPYAGDLAIWMGLLLSLRKSLYTAAYAQWWQDQGKAAAHQLRRFAETTPQSDLAEQLSAFARNVADELGVQIANEALAANVEQLQARIAWLLELLTITTLSTEASAWTYLLHKLSQMVRVPGISWDVRALLLQTWGNIAELRNNEFILRDWLNVRWSELGSLLSLQVPDSWHRLVIANLLSTPLTIPPQDLVSIVTYHADRFEAVLQQLMRNPATQRRAMDFFAILAQHRYSRRILLLDSMIIAGGYQRDIAEALLTMAYLEPGKDVIDLLEHYCQELLEVHELPPTLENYLRTYLLHFDVAYLQTAPTRELLQRLQRRNAQPPLRLPEDLRASVELWGTISEFIDRPNANRNWVRNLKHTISSSRVPQLAPEARQKLVGVLLPSLVESISIETDLGRVIDNLGRVLMGPPDTGVITPDLLLLEQMASKAGESYGRERPPIRLVPYIKVILGEARFLPFTERETFIDRCFVALLKGVDGKTQDNLCKNNLVLWPDEILTEWKNYLSRRSAIALTVALNRFREALQCMEMGRIVTMYDPIIEKHIKPQERALLELARQFIEAYHADNDALILAADLAIRTSPYRTFLGYTPEQSARINLAQSRQQAPSAPPAPVQAGKVKHEGVVQGEPQSALASNKSYVAEVQGQPITIGWFEWVVNLKSPYIQYRSSYLRGRIQQLESQRERNAEEKQELKSKKRELRELEKLPDDSQQLRPFVLEELIEDVLIQDAISGLIKQNPALSQSLDPEPDLQGIFNQLKVYYANSNSPLKSTDNKTIEDVMKALRIFRRRELFAHYLNNQKKKSSDWLKEEKRKPQSAIRRSYERAGITPPKTSVWPF